MVNELAWESCLLTVQLVSNPALETWKDKPLPDEEMQYLLFPILLIFEPPPGDFPSNPSHPTAAVHEGHDSLHHRNEEFG